MLVIDGKINSLLPDSQSNKIRNGVGIRNNKLYFVISKNSVSFYRFAQFFQRNLKAEQALYLDGSISSLYIQKTSVMINCLKWGQLLVRLNKQIAE